LLSFCSNSLLPKETQGGDSPPRLRKETEVQGHISVGTAGLCYNHHKVNIPFTTSYTLPLWMSNQWFKFRLSTNMRGFNLSFLACVPVFFLFKTILRQGSA